jgi:hypothetical protein
LHWFFCTSAYSLPFSSAEQTSTYPVQIWYLSPLEISYPLLFATPGVGPTSQCTVVAYLCIFHTEDHVSLIFVFAVQSTVSVLLKNVQALCLYLYYKSSRF